jgi:2-haloacid dehalogenase
MAASIEAVVFDVNETLSDMRPIGGRFAAVGLPEHAFTTWFASVLRDGFAAAAAGGMITFRDLAAGNLAAMLEAHGLPPESRDAQVAHVLSGLADLHVHPDVPPGLRSLAAAGMRLVTLTNGSSALSETMFARAGVLDLFEHRLSVEDVGRWKPAPEPYRYAAERCDVDPQRVALVAVHPWDVRGAQQAGLRGVWVNRSGGTYPAYLPAPDATVPSVAEVGHAVARLSEEGRD